MSSVVTQGALDSVEAVCGRWRGSGWSKRFRTTFAILYLLITVPPFAGAGVAAKGVVSWIALSCVTAAAYEWRARKMGVEITDHGIVLIRPLNSTKLTWSEIETFFARDGRYGRDKTVHVQRKRFIGQRVPKGIGLPLPTLAIISQYCPIGRWFGPCDLVCGERRVPQDEVLSFLNDTLQRFDPRGGG